MLIAFQSLIVLSQLAAPAGAAEEPKDGPTYTSVGQADEDYSLQGEFRGWQQPLGSPRGTQRIGVQVIALGDGSFAAVKYLGGLPGDGWDGKTRYRFDGKRLGDGALLIGLSSDLRMNADGGEVVDHAEQTIGRLERVSRVSPTMGVVAPEGATVLFDGSGTDYWQNAKVDADGRLMPGTETSEGWGDFRLHGEFLLPYKPRARGQARGNSGVYLQSRYEVQVLDSFGLEGVENECGALYKVRRPDVNMCFPPLTWQTYDIDFVAAKFDDKGSKTEPMRITVWQNGVPIHSNAEIPSKTGAGKPESPEFLPIKLQEHGNPVAYRNLWIIDTTEPGARDIDWLRLPLKAPPVPVGYGGIEPRFGT
jgi:hypothetical protein